MQISPYNAMYGKQEMASSGMVSNTKAQPLNEDEKQKYALQNDKPVNKTSKDEEPEEASYGPSNYNMMDKKAVKNSSVDMMF